jgi:hypothetical protein
MATGVSFRRVAGIGAGVLLFTGCGGPTSGGLAPSLQAPGVSSNARVADNRSRNDGLAQWDLLYVSNGNGVVNVYRYWQYTLVGVLSNFKNPTGECVDKAGNVYILDSGKNDIVEYAHGGKKPIAVINDSPYDPAACAIDGKSGNIAVANAGGGSRGGGNIAVYVHGKGNPIIYTDRNLYRFENVAYDDNGDIFTSDGCTYSSSCYGTSFAYLPKNGVNLVTIEVPSRTTSGYYEDVQSIQWDGTYWVIADFGALTRISISGGKASYVGEIDLGGTFESGPVWLYRKTPNAPASQAVGISYDENTATVYYWQYPAGGDPVASITKGLDYPAGLTVSLKQK